MKMANPLLNNAGTVHEYTKEEVEELYRCSQDIFYFAKKYCYVVHPKQGKINIVLRDYQKRLISTIVENEKVVCLASRQLGKCLSHNTLVNIKGKDGTFKTKDIKTIFEEF
jgi:hypothetical protein